MEKITQNHRYLGPPDGCSQNTIIIRRFTSLAQKPFNSRFFQAECCRFLCHPFYEPEVVVLVRLRKDDIHSNDPGTLLRKTVNQGCDPGPWPGPLADLVQTFFVNGGKHRKRTCGLLPAAAEANIQSLQLHKLEKGITRHIGKEHEPGEEKAEGKYMCPAVFFHGITWNTVRSKRRLPCTDAARKCQASALEDYRTGMFECWKPNLSHIHFPC